MKKALSMLLSLLLALSLVCCTSTAGENTGQSSAPKEEQVSAAPSDTTARTAPAAASPASAPSEQETVTVYVTETGSKYHADGCQYLSKSRIPIDLDEAKAGYDPCSKCHPPK